MSYKLRKLALKAIERPGNTPSHGLRKEGTEWGYYHPLPPDRNKQKMDYKNYRSHKHG